MSNGTTGDGQTAAREEAKAKSAQAEVYRYGAERMRDKIASEEANDNRPWVLAAHRETLSVLEIFVAALA